MTRTEHGQLAGLEAAVFGMLILVVGVLMISNAWGVIDAEGAARTAAREAARTFVTSPDGDIAAADQAGLDTLQQMGWRVPPKDVRPVSAVFERCALVTWGVTVPVPVIHLPWLRSGISGFEATAHHTERVDPYRSGVPGAASAEGAAACP